MRLNEKVSEKVARLMAGSEPEFGFMPIDNEQLAVAYAWYAQNRDRSDADAYLRTYCDKNGIDVSFGQIHHQPTTIGFTARMIMRGINLAPSSREWFENRIKGMQSYVHVDVMEPVQPVAQKPKTVQDYISDQVKKVLGELDGLVDTLILSHFKTELSPDSVLMDHNLKSVHSAKIVEYYKKQRDEIRAALDRTDDQLTEAYSSYYRPDLKKLEAYFDKIIGAALQLQVQTTTARKPRTIKPKSPEKLTGKLKYCPGIKELGINSVAPKKMIEAECVWVFNVKTRMLGVYYAEDRRGLSIKGQTVLNYSESRSIAKKVRKPNLTLPEFMQARKNSLDKMLDNIVAVETKMSGRINKDVVILRVSDF